MGSRPGPLLPTRSASYGREQATRWCSQASASAPPPLAGSSGGGIAGHPEATFLPPPRTSSTRSRAQGWSLLLSGPAASNLLLLLPCFESHLALKAPCAPTTKPLTRGIFHPLAKGWVHTRPFPLSTQGGFLERGIPGARERFPEVSSE